MVSTEKYSCVQHKGSCDVSVTVGILTTKSNCKKVRKLPVRPFDSRNKCIQKAVFNIFEHVSIQNQVV